MDIALWDLIGLFVDDPFFHAVWFLLLSEPAFWIATAVSLALLGLLIGAGILHRKRDISGD